MSTADASWPRSSARGVKCAKSRCSRCRGPWWECRVGVAPAQRATTPRSRLAQLGEWCLAPRCRAVRCASRCPQPVPGTAVAARRARKVSGTGARHRGRGRRWVPGTGGGCPQARESCGFLDGSGGRQREYWVAESFLCQLRPEASAGIPGGPCGLLWTSRGRRRRSAAGAAARARPARARPSPQASAPGRDVRGERHAPWSRGQSRARAAGADRRLGLRGHGSAGACAGVWHRLCSGAAVRGAALDEPARWGLVDQDCGVRRPRCDHVDTNARTAGTRALVRMSRPGDRRSSTVNAAPRRRCGMTDCE
jgi:hypothetical protein